MSSDALSQSRTECASGVEDLLRAYDRIMTETVQVPRFVRLNSTYSLDLPWPRWLFTSFVVYHIDRTLAAIMRRGKARAALGVSSEEEEHIVAASGMYRESLPPTHWRLISTMLVFGVVIVAGIALPLLGPVLQVREAAQVNNVVSQVDHALLAPTPTQVSQAMAALIAGGFDLASFVLSGVPLIGYVFLRPLVPAFRMKRMVFSIYPNLQCLLAVPVSVTRYKTGGVYSIERQVQEDYEAQSTKEFAFDLVVGILPLPFLMLGSIGSLVPGSADTAPIDMFMDLFILSMASWRLAWLLRTWRRRISADEEPWSFFQAATTRQYRVYPKCLTSLLVGFLSLPLGLFGIGILSSLVALGMARQSRSAILTSAGRFGGLGVARVSMAVAIASLAVSVILTLLVIIGLTVGE